MTRSTLIPLFVLAAAMPAASALAAESPPLAISQIDPAQVSAAQSAPTTATPAMEQRSLPGTVAVAPAMDGIPDGYDVSTASLPPMPDGANAALIQQSGTGNSAVITQRGVNNDAVTSQDGNNNRSDVTQVGNNNSFVHIQTGDGFAMEATQEGGASVTVKQTPF